LGHRFPSQRDKSGGMASKDKNLVIVRSVLDQGLSVKAAAQKFKVSPQWINTLIRRYQVKGPSALEPQSRAPKSRPQATTVAIESSIIELRKSLTLNGSDNGPETIKWHLEKEGFYTPAISTIRRILHKNGLITPEPRKRPRNSYLKFEAELPNECWQSDITHWFLKDGTRIEILDFLDDHSRYLLHLQAKTAFKGPDVVTAMQNLIDTQGAPASTLTDNGLVFTTRLATLKGAKNGFEKLLEANGITQKNGKPNHPQTQGKIERFHQTLKKWLKARPDPKQSKKCNNN
jgi:transposase InsO family protein